MTVYPVRSNCSAFAGSLDRSEGADSLNFPVDDGNCLVFFCCGTSAVNHPHVVQDQGRSMQADKGR